MRKNIAIIGVGVAAIAVVAVALLARTTPPSANGPIIAVSIVSHNEDTLSPRFPDFSADRAATIAQRDATLAFAEMLVENGAAYNFQTDWNFLLGLQKYDTTGFLGQLAGMGVSIDPHSHEHLGYNYADVAALIAAQGVEPSGVVGGFIAAPASDAKLERLWEPVEANKVDYTWEPTVLWGAGTNLHQNEEDLWISGVWRPASAAAFTTHDPSGPLPYVGGYNATWEGLEALLAAREAGELDADGLYTVTIMVTQDEITTAFTEDFAEQLATYTEATADGYLRWMTVQDVANLWQTSYNEQVNPLAWEGDGSSQTSAPNGRVSGCGNGVCEAIERQRNACPEDCP